MKTIRYLLLIYVISINDYVLEKRRMVFIYLPYSSGAVGIDGHTLRSLILQKNVRVDEQLYTEQYW